MNFGEALEAAKAGKKIQRAGWNGKGMYVSYVPAQVIHSDLVHAELAAFAGHSGSLAMGGYLRMLTADGSIQVGWLASQLDMLATDWRAEDIGAPPPPPPADK